MGQVGTSKQGHKGRCKRSKARKEVGECPFSTDRIAEKPREKINRLIAPEAPTHQAHLLLKSIEQALGLEMVGNDHDFLEYLIMPLSLIVWLVEAIREAVSHLLLSSIPSRASFWPAALQ